MPLSIGYSSERPIRKSRSKLRLEVTVSISHPPFRPPEISNWNRGRGEYMQKWKTHPRSAKQPIKLCKRLASTTGNQICGHNSSDPEARNAKDGLMVYSKQKDNPTTDSYTDEHWPMVPHLFCRKDPLLHRRATRNHDA